MEKIKDAFKKVKSDMDSLGQEIIFLKEEIKKISEKLENLHAEPDEIVPTQDPENQAYDSYSSTHEPLFKGLKPQNLSISTGNRGVPTDRQTDRQTDRHINIGEKSVDNAIEILNSLDNIRKEIRLKFKTLTEKEFLIFSTLYQLDEEKGETNYKEMSEKLNLTESSIRDYVGRLIRKGIPVEKNKINNKLISLSISEKLKKIATLPTILQLRDL